jgi:uncharacterized protein
VNLIELRPMKTQVLSWMLAISLSGFATGSETTTAEAEALFQQARAALRGDGVPKDVKKAYELMGTAAAAGHAEAIGGMGYFHSTGTAVVKDGKMALEWFRKGAEKGSSKAQLNLGKMLLEGADGGAEETRREGLSWIIRAAEAKLPEAALTYGNILYFGDHGVEKDSVKAAHYFGVAADQGLAEAQNFLGMMREMGLGLPVDEAMAKEWFRKAADQGNPKAQANLGRLLNPLSDQKQVREEALFWLVISANAGEVTAQKSLEDALPGLKEGELATARKRAAAWRVRKH